MRKRRITGLYALPTVGFCKTPVGLKPFVVFCSSTFFCARETASQFLLSSTKKRRIQPERYMQCGRKFNKIT